MNKQTILTATLAAMLVPVAHASNRADRGQLEAALGKVPLAFEENRGQSDPNVRFLARSGDYSVFLCSTEAVFKMTTREEQPSSSPWVREADRLDETNATYSTAVVRMKLIGSNPNPKATAVDPLPTRISYLAGPKSVVTSSYRQVIFENVWSGVYMVYYGNEQQLEYDFVVAPGTSPSAIRLAFAGVDRASVDGSGDLVLATSIGELRQHAPRVYQTAGSERIAVHGRYALLAGGQIGFEVGPYDHTRPLVIDPVFSRRWGGSQSDVATAVAVDKRTGETVVVGYTSSPDFPDYHGYPGGHHNDAFVTKIDATGNHILFSTYLGGGYDDAAYGVAVDKDGSIYVTGNTNSLDFPRAGYPSNPVLPRQTDFNFFVVKLSPSGQLLYSETFGGSGLDLGYGIAVTARGLIYVGGYTESYDFPVVDHQPTHLQGHSDAFLAMISWTAGYKGKILYSRYFGLDGEESARAIALEPSGNSEFPSVYLAGWTTSQHFEAVTYPGVFQRYYAGNTDAFVAKLRFQQVVYIVAGPLRLTSTPEMATLVGGSKADYATGISVDPVGVIYLTGYTSSRDFPTTRGAFQPYYGGGQTDAFVAKFNSKGAGLWVTYFGGSGDDYGEGIVVDEYDSAHFAGFSSSSDLPVTHNAAQWGNAGGTDGFFAIFNPDGDDIVYSTYLGAEKDDRVNGVALDSGGNATLAGFVTDPQYGDRDALFVRVLP